MSLLQKVAVELELADRKSSRTQKKGNLRHWKPLPEDGDDLNKDPSVF
jgi:hypothetical protein